MPISLNPAVIRHPAVMSPSARGLRLGPLFGDDGRGEVTGSGGDELRVNRPTRTDETASEQAFLDYYIGTESNPVTQGHFASADIDDLKTLVDRYPEDSIFSAIELGSRYQNGSRGASQDPVLAEHYYEVAATQHDPFGQYYLGLFLMHEKPKPPKALGYRIWEAVSGARTATQNEILGYAWLSLAATKHHPRKVDEMQSAEKELAEADRWMSTWSRRKALGIAEKWYQGWLAQQGDDV